ncbi:MAG: 5-(carboxyamino)imidazole ribonucleotide mutase [Candidatus Cloacimonetes bacterium]|nr:5-(carboxyamino)imidazole ribonucleotide mutase [Candidatus Cloacimonadota bacterium]
MPLVRVIAGSKSDSEHIKKVLDTLESLNISYDQYYASAHRTPDTVVNLTKNAENDGVKVFIAMAGMAAHLPGVIAGHTTLPVIGVPLSGSALNGLDALYSVVQMPKGIPVATVAIDGSINAATLAAQIIALSDNDLSNNLKKQRQDHYK